MVLSSKLKGRVKNAKSKKGGALVQTNKLPGSMEGTVIGTGVTVPQKCIPCLKPGEFGLKDSANEESVNGEGCTKKLLNECKAESEGMEGVDERLFKLVLDASEDAQLFNRLSNPAYNSYIAREIAERHILSILSNSKKFKEAQSVLHFTGLNEQGSKLNNMIDLTLENISNSELLLEGFNRADFKKFCSKERENLYAELDTEVNKKLEEFMRKVMGEKYTTLKGETTLAKFKDFFSGRDFVESSKYIQVFRVLLLSELHSSSDEFTKIILENSGLSLKSLNDIKESLKLALTTGSQKGGGSPDEAASPDKAANAQIRDMMENAMAKPSHVLANEYARVKADEMVEEIRPPELPALNKDLTFGAAAYKVFKYSMVVSVIFIIMLSVAYAMSTSTEEAQKALVDALEKQLKESLDPSNEDTVVGQGMVYIRQAVGAASKEVTGLAKGVTGVGVDFGIQQIINHMGILSSFLTTFGFFMVMKFGGMGKVTAGRLASIKSVMKDSNAAAKALNGALSEVVEIKRQAFVKSTAIMVEVCAAAASNAIEKVSQKNRNEKKKITYLKTQLALTTTTEGTPNNNSSTAGAVVIYNGGERTLVSRAEAELQLALLEEKVEQNQADAAHLLVDSANALYNENARKIFLENPHLIAAIRRSLFATPELWLHDTTELREFRDPKKRAQIFLKSISNDKSYEQLRKLILVQFVEVQKQVAKKALEERILHEDDEVEKNRFRIILVNLEKLTNKQAEIDFYYKLKHEGAPMVVDRLINLVSNIILVIVLGRLYGSSRLHELIPLYQGIVDYAKYAGGSLAATYASSGYLTGLLGVAVLQHPIVQLIVGGSAGVGAVAFLIYHDLEKFNKVGEEILKDGYGDILSGYKRHLFELIIKKLRDYIPSVQGEEVIKKVVEQLITSLEEMKETEKLLRSPDILQNEIFRGKDSNAEIQKDVNSIFTVIHDTLVSLDKLIPNLQTGIISGNPLNAFALPRAEQRPHTGELVPFQSSPGGGAAPPAPAPQSQAPPPQRQQQSRAPPPPPPANGVSVATGNPLGRGGARKKSRRQKRNNRKNRTTKRNRSPMKSKHQKRRNNGRMSNRK